MRNLAFELVDECRPPARKAAFVDQDDRPATRRCRGHTGGLLSGIGCVNADVVKKTTKANGNDFDLFGVLVDEENCYGLALRHRPISNA